MTNAAWKPDPWHHHQLRYHDGTAWTEHVADNQVQARDPVIGEPPETSAGTSMQPSSKTVLWEGQKASLGSVATAGKVVTAKYRITTDALIFEAGLVSTKEEVIPLWAVMDVDLRQSMTQKPRNVGDLHVRLDPAGAKYGQTVVLLESIKDPRAVRDLIARQANIMRTAMLTYQHEREVEKRQAGAMNLSFSAGAGSQPTPTEAEKVKTDPHELMEQIGSWANSETLAS